MKKPTPEEIAEKTAELYHKASTIPHLIDMVLTELPLAEKEKVKLSALSCDGMVGHYFIVEGKELKYKGGL